MDRQNKIPSSDAIEATPSQTNCRVSDKNESKLEKCRQNVDPEKNATTKKGEKSHKSEHHMKDE